MPPKTRPMSTQPRMSTQPSSNASTEVSELKRKLTLSQSEVTKCKKTVADLNTQLASKQKDINIRDTEIQILRDGYVKSTGITRETVYTLLEDTILKLQLQIKALQGKENGVCFREPDSNALQQRILSLEDKLKHMAATEEMVKRLHIQLKYANDKAAEQEVVKNEAVHKITELLTENANIKLKLESTESNISTLTKELDAERETTLKTRTQFDESECRLNKTIKEKENIISGLSMENQQLRDLKNKYEKLAEDARENKNATVDEERNRLQDQLSEKDSELITFKSQLSSLEEEKVKFHSEINTLQTSCHEAFRKIEQKEKDMEKMKNAHKELIERKEATIQTLRNERVQMESTVNSSKDTSKELEQAKAELEELKNRLRVQGERNVDDSELKILRTQLAQLEREKIKLHSDLDALQTSCHEAFRKMEQKEKEMKQLKTTNKELIERKEKTIQELRREIIMLEAQK